MARDLYHDNFRRALEKDGWCITHDPFPIRVGRIGYEVDFGAEKLIAAEKGNEKIVRRKKRKTIAFKSLLLELLKF